MNCYEIKGNIMMFAKPPSEAYSEGYDRIFGGKKNEILERSARETVTKQKPEDNIKDHEEKQG